MVTLKMIEEKIDENYFNLKHFMKSTEATERAAEIEQLREKLMESLKDFYRLKLLQEKYDAS